MVINDCVPTGIYIALRAVDSDPDSARDSVMVGCDLEDGGS